MPSYKVDKKEGVYMISVFYFLLAVLYPYATIIHRLFLVSLSLMAFITAFLDFPETLSDAVKIIQAIASMGCLFLSIALVGSQEEAIRFMNTAFFYGLEYEWNPFAPIFITTIANLVSIYFEQIILDAKTAAEYKRLCEKGEIYDVALVRLS